MTIASDTEYAGYPAVARARTELGNILSRAREQFEDDPKVKAFLDRLAKGGDLHKKLWDAITLSVDDGDRSSKIAAKCIAEVDKMWRANPPGPVDFLKKLFAQPQAKRTTLGKVMSADGAAGGSMTDARRREVLNMGRIGRGIVASEPPIDTTGMGRGIGTMAFSSEAPTAALAPSQLPRIHRIGRAAALKVEKKCATAKKGFMYSLISEDTAAATRTAATIAGKIGIDAGDSDTEVAAKIESFLTT